MCDAAGVKWKQLKRAAVEDTSEVEDSDLKNYPANGSIVFENVKMRYRPTASLALRGINLKISHGERVGLIGRTGSGKSTMLLAIYRMFELQVRSISCSLCRRRTFCFWCVLICQVPAHPFP
jgi:ABC-type multidrug transport system fused ATPase/permease subunit